ncbi:AMP-binding enzyme [Eggerthella lenta]
MENAIFDYPGISDAVVIGIPDQQWGLRVHAILEIEGAESEFSTDGLKEFLHTKLSGYKCPKTYEIVQDMPRNEMGKIRRRELIEQRVSSLSEREPGTKA